MISSTTVFNSQIQEYSRTFRARLLNGTSLVDAKIKNVKIHKGACGDPFSVGSVYSSYIEMTLDECEEALENKELLLQIGLVIGEEVEYINVGYYTVTKPSKSAYQTTFTAVGRITSKLNCLPDSLPQETTLANLAEAITDTTGVTIACNGVTLAGAIEKDLTGLTCKELLEVITAVLGGFATENSAGGITISKFSTSNPISYNGERTTTDPQFSDYDYELSGIKVITTEEWEDEEGTVHPEVSFTEGTPRQTLSLQYMTQSLFSVFAENVVGFTYRPGTVPLALGDPRLEPWDTIKFTDVKGDVYIVPCLNITHSFDGGLSTTITAPGESESESETQSKGPLVKQLERVSSQLFTAEQAIVKRITADEADLRYATVESLNAAEANIENLSGSFASFKTGEFESLKASVVTTDTLEAKVGEFGYVKTSGLEAAVANVGFLTVLDAEAQYATITSLNATDAKITNLSAKAITTDNLSAKVATLGYATVSQLEATEGKIDSLTSIAITTYNLSAKVGEFGYLTVDDFVGDNAQFNYLKTNELEAEVGKFGYLSAADFEGETARFDYLKVETAEITYATITQLEVIESEIIDNLEANYATISSLNATNATITSLSGDFTSFKNGEFENLKTNVATIEEAYMDEAAVDTLVASKGYLTEAEVDTLIVGKGYITTAQTNTLLSNYVKTTELSATNATVSSLSSDFASFKTSTTGTLEAQEASIESLTANDVELETLISNKANVSSLNTANANISTLQSKVSDIEKAYISTASVNTLLADYVKTSKLTADYITSSQISAAYAKISDLTAATARIGTLETNTLKTADLSAEVAKLGYASAANLEATDAKIDNLSSVYARIDFANVENGSVTTAMIGAGVVGTAQIADGSITEAKIVSLTANKITAGTLSVERLIIRGSTSSLVYALNDITGALQSNNANTLNGEILTGRSITADKIVANSITANEIAAAAINANKIATGAVTADKLSVSTLSAISANLGTVTAGILQSENYQESDYLVDSEGNVTGTVIEGLKIDLNNKAYYTPQITIKDNYIKMQGHITIGNRENEIGDSDVIGANSITIGSCEAEGANSIATGGWSCANGVCSAAFGYGLATGDFSFATGMLTKAQERSSHAEGTCTVAGGDSSHAEGFFTGANGDWSHAEGLWTMASGSCQHVQGKFNVRDKDGVYAHIVGNGTSNSALSNAHTLDWEGNAWYAGGITAATGTLEGELLIDTGTTQSATKGIRWSAINSRNPYMGYALNQSDGTFLIGSLLGTDYQSGLAIGGGSGNLLWKGSRVATATDLSSYALNSHTHNYAGSSSSGGVANSAAKLATARTINGVSFDGSENITVTANPATTALSNVDLNNYKTPGFYSGGDSNGCSNKPSGVDSFGLIVFKNASGYICQMLVGGNQKTNIAYLRTCTGSSWTGWVSQYSTDNKPTLTELGITATATEVNVLDGITATVTELNYCDGVTSNIQTQLNGKAATHSHPYMSSSPVSIELNSTGSLSGYGGFIDFHYNGNTADYTSRIIENSSGQLAINGVTITSEKVVTATTFVGSLSGNATSATKATQDGNGNVIAGTYLPLSGGTLTGALTVGGARIAAGSSVSILGTTKNATTVSNQLVLQNGAVFSGTAAEAGLVTRGICGVTTPDANGGCSKENLYINYDSTNTYSSARQVILQAGNCGTHYGNNLYQYAAARGDAVKGWVEAQGYALSGHTHSYLPLSGGALTGNLTVGSASMETNGYVTGTWLKTTAASALTSAAAKIAVLDGSGWIYYRTPAQILSDIGAAASSHKHNSLYHSSTGTQVTIVGLDGDYYYFRPVDGLDVVLGSTSNPYYRLYTKNLRVTAGKPVFTYIGSDGSGSTVSYATNLYVASGGTVSRTTNTSSRTIKHDITDLCADRIKAERLYSLPVCQAKYNEGILGDEDDRYMKDLPMFIIEDMDEIYPVAVDKPSDNVKEWSWNSQYLIPPMLKLIQEQHKEDVLMVGEIEIVKARLNSAETKLDAALIKIAEQEKEIERLKSAA